MMLHYVKRFFSQGPHRKVLRRRLVLLSILPALVLLAIGAKLVTMVAYGSAATSDYLDFDSRGLADDVRMLKSVNVIDSYKAYFADGDRYVLDGKLGDAQAEFTTSLSLVDPEDSCPVRINLEVVLETQGDLKSADDHRDEAKPLWQEALKTVQEAPVGCFDTKTEPDEAVRKQLNETEQRLLDKLKDLEPGTGGGGGGDQGGEGGDGGGQGGGDDQGQGEAPPGGPGQGQGEAPPGGPGQGQGEAPPGGEGQAPAPGGGQGGDQGQGQGQGPTSPGDPAPNTVGADRIATDSGGSVQELKPKDGDPDEVLKRLLENSDASGVDRE
jgi:hypothetical protein